MFILGIRIFCQNSQSGVNSSRVPPPPYPPPAHEKTVLQLSDFLPLPDAPSLIENVHVWSNKNSTMLQNQYADLLEEVEYFKKCWVKENRKMHMNNPRSCTENEPCQPFQGARNLAPKKHILEGANHTDRFMEVKGRLVTFESWRSFIISLDLYQQLTIFPPQKCWHSKKETTALNFFKCMLRNQTEALPRTAKPTWQKDLKMLGGEDLPFFFPDESYFIRF